MAPQALPSNLWAITDFLLVPGLILLLYGTVSPKLKLIPVQQDTVCYYVENNMRYIIKGAVVFVKVYF
jgi:hypothetical protein